MVSSCFHKTEQVMSTKQILPSKQGLGVPAVALGVVLATLIADGHGPYVNGIRMEMKNKDNAEDSELDYYADRRGKRSEIYGMNLGSSGNLGQFEPVKYNETARKKMAEENSAYWRDNQWRDEYTQEYREKIPINPYIWVGGQEGNYEPVRKRILDDADKDKAGSSKRWNEIEKFVNLNREEGQLQMVRAPRENKELLQMVSAPRENKKLLVFGEEAILEYLDDDDDDGIDLRPGLINFLNDATLNDSFDFAVWSTSSNSFVVNALSGIQKEFDRMRKEKNFTLNFRGFVFWMTEDTLINEEIMPLEFIWDFFAARKDKYGTGKKNSGRGIYHEKNTVMLNCSDTALSRNPENGMLIATFEWRDEDMLDVDLEKELQEVRDYLKSDPVYKGNDLRFKEEGEWEKKMEEMKKAKKMEEEKKKKLKQKECTIFALVVVAAIGAAVAFCYFLSNGEFWLAVTLGGVAATLAVVAILFCAEWNSRKN